METFSCDPWPIFRGTECSCLCWGCRCWPVTGCTCCSAVPADVSCCATPNYRSLIFGQMDTRRKSVWSRFGTWTQSNMTQKHEQTPIILSSRTRKYEKMDGFMCRSNKVVASHACSHWKNLSQSLAQWLKERNLYPEVEGLTTVTWNIPFRPSTLIKKKRSLHIAELRVSSLTHWTVNFFSRGIGHWTSKCQRQFTYTVSYQLLQGFRVLSMWYYVVVFLLFPMTKNEKFWISPKHTKITVALW